MSVNELLDHIDHYWAHCLRCPLADIRCQIDQEKDYLPAGVPRVVSADDWGLPNAEAIPRKSKLHLLLSTPDIDQWQTGSIAGTLSETNKSDSLNRAVIEDAFEQLRDYLPFGLEGVSVGLALGCRPVNFKNPRILSKAKAEWTKACRPRWQTELKIVDPDLVLICGRHALASVAPRRVSKFALLLGEIVEFEIDGAYGPVRYYGYVTEATEVVALASREDDLNLDEWQPQPSTSRALYPFRSWCWDLLMASWIAELLAARRSEDTIADTRTWDWLVRRLNEFYDEVSSVRQIVSRVRREVDLTTGAIPLPASTVELEEDDDEEDDTEEGEGTDEV